MRKIYLSRLDEYLWRIVPPTPLKYLIKSIKFQRLLYKFHLIFIRDTDYEIKFAPVTITLITILVKITIHFLSKPPETPIDLCLVDIKINY